MSLPKRVRWGRSQDGFVASKCGRFKISPYFAGCTRPVDFSVHDIDAGRVARRETQRDCKEWAEMQLDYEAHVARKQGE
ncbi:hypothetical protein CKO28_03255 [Rhodovibrio sodomensis]|uniref:Uncharacterized protein n=1 Tax=Rhodovibrio sodomensis TaxID=1088 RepID=A0ABS1D9J0_9PROT|nr:hypothetical protein [Rhodovibrio sodomensis]MBK1667062.1 hypothetical protein [Rhodovibrio sodomensis]